MQESEYLGVPRTDPDRFREEGWDEAIAAVSKLVTPFIMRLVPNNPYREEDGQ